MSLKAPFLLSTHHKKKLRYGLVAKTTQNLFRLTKLLKLANFYFENISFCLKYSTTRAFIQESINIVSLTINTTVYSMNIGTFCSILYMSSIRKDK